MEDPPQEKIDTINDEPDSDEEDANADNFISNVSDIEGENIIAQTKAPKREPGEKEKKQATEEIRPERGIKK